MHGDYTSYKHTYSDKTTDIALAAGGTGTIVPKSAKHRVYVQKVEGSITTHANAKYIRITDGTLIVTLVNDLTKAAGVPDEFRQDWGPKGFAFTLGATVTIESESSGPVADVHVEAYEKLDADLNYLAGATSQ